MWLFMLWWRRRPRPTLIRRQVIIVVIAAVVAAYPAISVAASQIGIETGWVLRLLLTITPTITRHKSFDAVKANDLLQFQCGLLGYCYFV